MIQLTLDNIKDYLYCPKYYKLCNIDKIAKSKDATIINHFENSVDKTVKYFFYCVQEGFIPSLKDIRNKFGTSYIVNRSKEQAMLLSRSLRNTARVLEKRGTKMLTNFYNTFSIEHGIPIIIDKEFFIDIKNVRLIGTIPIIREYKDEIEILHPISDTSAYKQWSLHCLSQYDISLTAISLISNKLYKNIKNNYYGLFSNKSIIVNKDSIDYKNFLYTIDKVGTAIQAKDFHGVYNENCINCTYNKTCNRL